MRRFLAQNAAHRPRGVVTPMLPRLLGLLAIVVLGCSPPRPAVFLALGDSYTIGQSVDEADRWPVQLAAALEQDDDLGEPQIVAVTGWTTTDLLLAMDRAPLAKSYPLLTLMIGVNDEFQRQPIDGFTTRVGVLLDRSIGLAGGDARHVIAISIPDWGVTPFAEGNDRAAIARDVEAFNVAYAAECAKRHVTFVDVTPISRQAATQAATLIAPDGLHPSAAMYAEWAAAIEPAAFAALHAPPLERRDETSATTGR